MFVVSLTTLGSDVHLRKIMGASSVYVCNININDNYKVTPRFKNPPLPAKQPQKPVNFYLQEKESTLTLV